jgi:Na+-transporting NADH:ubiquinone oxidoreductase subunit NqrF
MTEMEKSHRPWNGETGLINQEMLVRHLKGAEAPIYYLAGPPAMVKGLHEMLSKAGIIEDDIRAEEFGGY